MSQKLQEKISLIKKLMANEEMERPAFLPSIQSYGIWYGGGTSEECIGDPAKELSYYGKCVKEAQFDGVSIFGCNWPLLMYKSLGYSNVFISKDKVTLQQRDHQAIRDDEIELFAKNPMAFYTDVVIPRTYPGLMKPYPENVNAAKDAILGLMAFGQRGQYVAEHLASDYETPMFCPELAGFPTDSYLTLRSVRGMSDFRRKPELVEEILTQMTENMISHEPHADFPYLIAPMTMGGYFNPKQFDRFYWPFFKKIADANAARGAKMVLFLEGDWSQHYDHFQDLQSGSFIIMLDQVDMLEAKKKLGDKFGLMYGFPATLLHSGTPEDVVNYAKKMMDELGNKGTAISIDKALMSPWDAKPENLRALGEFCQTYRF